MALSFWKKRQSDQTSDSYIRSVNSVSRPISLILTVVGILLIGGLLFGVFQGARWSFNKLAGNDSPKVSRPSNVSQPTTTSSSGSSAAPSVTATSSTSTNTPSSSSTSTTSAAVPATNTQALPQTGPGSNTAIFLAVLLLSYFAYRHKSLKR